MQIHLIEMPAERVHRVKCEGVTVPGHVNQGNPDDPTTEDESWYWRCDNTHAVGYLTKETAALALVIRFLDSEYERLRKKTSRQREGIVANDVVFWLCGNCHRTLSRPVSSPPSICSCGHPRWEEQLLDDKEAT